MTQSKFLRVAFFLASLFLGCDTFAQVPKPKQESWLHHIFESHQEGNDLEGRFNDIKCALVIIQSDGRQGTGFYISADGDIATASHVLGDRTFRENKDGTFQITLITPLVITITNSRGEKIEFPHSSIELNADAWGADVALIKSNKAVGCWLRTGHDDLVKPGQHLIAMGFPGLAFGSLSLYTGIMSARLKSELIIGTTVDGKPVKATNELIRVQMPISTGLSGAPVIDDENRVISVVTSAGAWTRDLDVLVQLQRLNAFAVPPSPNPQQTNLNVFSVLGQLAGIFHDYLSPGYGDSVPMSYLKKSPPSSPPPSAPVR
jgi:S1-C subfamily serine protease